MIAFHAKPAFARADVRAAAIEIGGSEQNPVMASKVLGLRTTRISGASHGVQPDDPAAVNAALDAFLANIPTK